MKSVTLRRPVLRDEMRRYLLAFLLGFGSLLLVILPIIIADGGYYIYYGDYNSQQIPFYNLANDAVRSGSFGWNWYTDLGVNFIGSYAFYLLGSPFFWLSVILPRSWVTFAMPVLLCMKHGIASLTAYAYIRRFVRNPNAALIGGMLYAFSGFQLFNIFFNHFQDVTAFFPLLLIAMEELVNQNRRGVFALSVALLAIINYFFFTGQVVFLVLYFIVRCFSKDFHATLRKFFLVLLEAVIGVMIACVILLPAALAILANSRVSEHLFGMDMIAYNDRTRIWRILLSLFMIPDVPARPNLFSSDYAKWASIGGYLPMFSMAGVLAFLKQRDGHWAKRITVICGHLRLCPDSEQCILCAEWFVLCTLVLYANSHSGADDCIQPGQPPDLLETGHPHLLWISGSVRTHLPAAHQRGRQDTLVFVCGISVPFLPGAAYQRCRTGTHHLSAAPQKSPQAFPETGTCPHHSLLHCLHIRSGVFRRI